jgi:hypothetical protein
MWPVISMLAEGIKKAGAERSIVDLRSVVEVKVPTHTERQHWNELNRAANFLKHADVDYDKSLREDEVNCDALINGGCRLYMDLMGHLTPEMQVRAAYEFVTHGVAVKRDEPLGDIAWAFQSIEPKHRRAAGIKLIEIQKKYGLAAHDPPK